MAEGPTQEGTLILKGDSSNLVSSTKKGADETVKNLERVEKAEESLQKEMQQTAKVAEATSKKVAAVRQPKVGQDGLTHPERQAKWARERTLKAQAKEEARIAREARISFNRMHDEANRMNRRVDLAAFAERKRLRDIERREERNRELDAQKIAAITNRSVLAPRNVQGQIQRAIQGPQNAAIRASLMAGGMTRQQAFSFALQGGGLSQQASQYLAFGAGNRPPGWGGGPGGGGPGGFMGRAGRAFGAIGRSVLQGVGIGVGAYGAGLAVEGIRAVAEANQLATAYDRQRVAAESLAGGQGKLNALLQAYEKASGGVVDKATELANVTRLMATGFADSAPEVEKFVRATRGASIALGKPQDYIIQETQLAISNTSVKRLDQIGLGVTEVTDKIKELQKANKDLSREEAFRDAVLTLMSDKYGALTDSIEGQATGLEKLTKAWNDLFLAMGQSQQGAVGGLLSGLAKFIEQLEQSLIKQEELGRRAAIRGNSAPITGNRGFWGSMDELSQTMFSNRPSLTEDQITYVLGRGAATSSRRASSARNPLAAVDTGPSEEVIAVRNNAYAQLESLEEQHQQKRTQVVADYNSQRLSLVENFNRQMARSDADFARQRARSLEDYEEQILDVVKEGRKREQQWREDTEEQIAEIREDSAERVQEMEEDYAEERERAFKDHQDRMLSAAGQLDAIAVLEERKRWRKENEEREKGHKEAVEKQKEALDEQIADAREALEERLKDAREADEERLRDMAADRAKQLRREDEDRAIQRERQIEDHNAQLAELDRMHSLTLQAMEQQLAEEKKAIEDALAADLSALGYYIEGYQEKMKERDQLIEDWFDRVIQKLEDEIAGRPGDTYRYDPERGPIIPGDYSSGLIPGNGASGNTYSNSRSVVIQPGAIMVTTTPGLEMMVGSLVEEKLIDILENN